MDKFGFPLCPQPLVDAKDPLTWSTAIKIKILVQTSLLSFISLFTAYAIVSCSRQLYNRPQLTETVPSRVATLTIFTCAFGGDWLRRRFIYYSPWACAICVESASPFVRSTAHIYHRAYRVSWHGNSLWTVSALCTPTRFPCHEWFLCWRRHWTWERCMLRYLLLPPKRTLHGHLYGCTYDWWPPSPDIWRIHLQKAGLALVLLYTCHRYRSTVGRLCVHRP